MRVVLFFAFICVFAAGLLAQAPAATIPAGPTYDALLAKLKAGDTSIDFKSLRMAYAETKAFSSLGDIRDVRAKVTKAFNEKKYKEAVLAADEIFATNYVDIDTHLLMAMAHRPLGDEKKSKFHEAVYVGLVNSILSSGDGTSTKTAYKVIAISEEYAVLRALELKRGSQALLEEGGQKFDVLTATDAANAPQKVYFNIDVLWKGYDKLGKP